LDSEKQKFEKEMNELLERVEFSREALSAAQQAATKAQIEADGEREAANRAKQRVAEIEVLLRFVNVVVR
jgi:transcription elongation GreA/GreB family factor